LLDLIDQKRQHHQYRQRRRQMTLTMPVIMLEMISLILQRIEGLILDLPSPTSGAHHLLSAERLAEDGKLLSFNGFHIENCW
jgi:hypothetical protein